MFGEILNKQINKINIKKHRCRKNKHQMNRPDTYMSWPATCPESQWSSQTTICGYVSSTRISEVETGLDDHIRRSEPYKTHYTSVRTRIDGWNEKRI